MACQDNYIVHRDGRQSVPVPCGKCPPCKRRRVSDWAFRLEQEDKVSQSSLFVTLTYNTDHVPISKKGYMTLVKTVPHINKKGKETTLPHPKSPQAFIKRLRKLQKSTAIKYYLCGEYGTKTNRPHYHIILFNANPAFISQAWTFGDIHIGNVEAASIKYCAKYIDKAKRIPMHRNDDRLPEFSLMSKKLGHTYLTPQMKKYHQDRIYDMYVTRKDGIKLAMPRYYRNILFTEEQRKLQAKKIRQLVEDKKELDKRTFLQDYPHADYDEHLVKKRLAIDQLHYLRINKNPRK